MQPAQYLHDESDQTLKEVQGEGKDLNKYWKRIYIDQEMLVGGAVAQVDAEERARRSDGERWEECADTFGQPPGWSRRTNPIEARDSQRQLERAEVGH
eukprot:748079-Hanusia_phi.AAC.2